MSYGQSSLLAADALHVIGFPELVRRGARRLQIQLASGCLCIEGRGMAFLLRDLLAGKLTDIQPGRDGAGVNVERVHTTATVTEEKEPYQIAECCPVADDLVLLETGTSKDYLARSELAFFGRLGRPKSAFVLGLRERSYRIEALPGQGDVLAAAVFASRLILGTTNVFTALAPEYYLPWPEITRHHVSSIEEIDHRPEAWDTGVFVEKLHLGPTHAPMSLPQRRNIIPHTPEL